MVIAYRHNNRRRAGRGRGLVPMFSACVLLLCAGSSAADEARGTLLTVQITCPAAGTLYAYLVDEAHFSRPNVGLQKRVVEVTGKGVVRVEFPAVRPGTYGVRCFLDLNGNGKLDRGLFGPTEPWGMSFRGGRPERWPSWDKVKLTVTGEPQTVRLTIRE